MININPNKIITEGKFDQDMFEDPVMVMVDLDLDRFQEATDDLIYGGKNDEMSLVDIIARDDPTFIELDEAETKIEVPYISTSY